MSEDLTSKQPPDHVAYADESHQNTGRFRGLALVTMPITEVTRASELLQQLMEELGLSELKWTKIRGGRERVAAMRLLRYAIAAAGSNLLRVDALTWDTYDSRHDIQGRSDVRNIRRMYYFLFKDVLLKRWPSKSIWRLHVDDSSSAPWVHLPYLEDTFEWETGRPLSVAI